MIIHMTYQAPNYYLHMHIYMRVYIYVHVLIYIYFLGVKKHHSFIGMYTHIYKSLYIYRSFIHICNVLKIYFYIRFSSEVLL